MLTALSGFAVNALLARLLAPNELGAYFLIFSVVSFAALLAQLGMKQTVVRLVAEALSRENKAKALQTIKKVLAIVSFGVLFVGALYYLYVGRWLSENIFESSLMLSVIVLTVLWIAALTYQTVLAETFRGVHDIRYASIFGGLCTSSFSVILLAALWFYSGQSDLYQVMILAVLAASGSVLIGGGLLGNKISPWQSGVKGGSVEISLNLMLPLYFTAILVFLMQGAHIWILAMYKDEGVVALYGAAFRLVNLVAMPLLIINSVLPPMISDLFTKGKIDKVQKVLQTTATIAGIPSVILLSVFIYMGEDLLAIVFGDYYIAAYQVLTILAIGKIVNVLTGSPGILLVMSGNQKLSLSSSIISGFISLLVSFLLVEEYGATGVSIGLSVGLVLHNVLMWWYCYSKVGVSTHMTPALLRDILSPSSYKQIFKRL